MLGILMELVHCYVFFTTYQWVMFVVGNCTNNVSILFYLYLNWFTTLFDFLFLPRSAIMRRQFLRSKGGLSIFELTSACISIHRLLYRVMATKLFGQVIEIRGFVPVCCWVLRSVLWACGLLLEKCCPGRTIPTQQRSTLSCNWESPDGENVPKWWQYCHVADARVSPCGEERD